MRDLELWRRLQEPPSEELIPDLLLLAERPLAERVPYLGSLAPLLKSPQTSLRKAALAALAGAGGPRALQHMVDLLCDPEESVALQAVHTLARSIGRDPGRWVHALFHPRPEIRAAAAALPESAPLSLFALADPACAPHLTPPRKVEACHTPTLLQWLAQGVLPSSGRDLLTDRHLAWLLEQPQGPTGLDQLFQLFWDDQPAAVDFWRRATRLLEAGKRRPLRGAVIDTLIARGLASGHWPAAPSRLIFALHPNSLARTEIPREVRRRGLEALMRSGTATLPDRVWESLAGLDLFAPRGDGTLDLWAWGALLFLAPLPHQRAALLPWSALLAAARQEPDQVAFLFLAPGHDVQARRLFGQHLAEDAGEAFSAVGAGLLLAGDGAGAVPYLAQAPGLVADTLVRLEGQPGVSLSDKRQGDLAHRLALALKEHPEVAFGLLGRSSLANDVLADLSRLTEPEALVAACLRIDATELTKVLTAITNCSAFFYPTERLLAKCLEGHSHPAVQEWVQARSAARETTGPRVGAPRSRLSQDEQRAIIDCLDDDLRVALRPALAAPSQGLVEALQVRSDPVAPIAAAVLALIACHDPIDQVAAQLTRYSQGGADFEDEVSGQWSMHPDLPFHGHVWLQRFDFHIDRVEAALDSLRPMLSLAQSFPGPLEVALWKMMARLCARWRYRDRSKLTERTDRDLVLGALAALEGPGQKYAAICLAQIFQGEAHPELMAELRPTVQERLPDLEHDTRMELAGYVNSRGLGRATLRRRGRQGSDEELGEIRRSTSLTWLSEVAAGPRGALAVEAALRLLDFGEAGASELLPLILEGKAEHAPLLAETAGLWPKGAGRQALREGLTLPTLEPEVVFAAGLSLLEDGEPLLPLVLSAARAPSEAAWFQKAYWDRLLRCGIEANDLALELAPSPHPHAYTQAVEWALSQGVKAALIAFLEAGCERHGPLRLRAAHVLWQEGDLRGFPLLFTEALSSPGLAQDLGRVPLAGPVESVMLAGPAAYQERDLLSLVNALPDPAFEDAALVMLRLSRRPESCQSLLRRLPRSSRRQDMLTRVARSFAWGVKMGRRLTGRLFQVEMHGGEALGFTDIESNRIHINPLPMFRSDRHGREVVEGLILHELGHHVYHRGPEKKEVWDRAQERGLFRLLNLVSDEHLERNLRTMERDFDLKLKRLAAFAFLHDRREVEIGALLEAMQHRSLAVLSGTALKVARQAGCVSLRSGDVFHAMEQSGASFARFVRGLRTGRGDRYGDPLVAEALALFKPSFRNSDMEQLWEVTLRLQEIFGEQTRLLQALSQDHSMCPDSAEVIVVGEGLTPEEMRRELERLSRGGEENPTGGGARWINKNEDLEFPPITTVVPVPADPALGREYTSQVARFAHHLRDVFRRLGLSYVRQKQRLQGRRVDRSRLHHAILRGEMRILEARKLVVSTDLFLGVIVDCSGSMTGDCLHKARLFATLVAQAAQGLPGLDMRVLGFTDSVIYDAGDANRSTAYNLQAGGGNNDAAALDFAANLARRSRRRARLLIMISDGLPTQCSVAALAGLVDRLGRNEGILCAQVAVRPLKEICFPHYMELAGDESTLAAQVAEFGRIVARLTYKSLR